METLTAAHPRAIPQTEMLEVPLRRQKMCIGIPREKSLQENRVALAPHSVKSLVNNGHRVLVHAGAGDRAKFTDLEYSESGAEIVHDRKTVFEADVLLKTAPPRLDEIELMRPNQVLISPITLPIINADYIVAMQKKRIIALAMEYIRDEDSHIFPIVRAMSEIAGNSSILIAADLLSSDRGGQGLLLGGIAGVPPAKIIILGAGVVAEFATRTALGLGAEVRIFDDNIHKLMRLQNQVGRQLHTSVLNPKHLEFELISADVAIGAVHSKKGRSPIIVSEEMVQKMKNGAVIVDVSIDQGGCFETSEMTSLDRPTFVKHGVIHYCVPNIASRIARTASEAISNILTSILLKSEGAAGIVNLITSDFGLRHGIYIYKGSLTNDYLGRRFHLKSTDVNLLITSDY